MAWMKFVMQIFVSGCCAAEATKNKEQDNYVFQKDRIATDMEEEKRELTASRWLVRLPAAAGRSGGRR
jgi:hypothetical protein